MGLLTNVKTRRRLVSLISAHNNKLCLLSYVAGLAWFLGLAHRPLNAGTYFSENALLPGLVEAHFHHEHGASDILQNLKEELRAIKKVDPRKERYNQIPAQWLEEKFQSLGLDTYVQNFTFKYPAGMIGDHMFGGQSVYGILRAPRTASTEAIVLSAPYRPPDDENPKNNHAIALLIALAKAFRQHTYWAKDIIFLVTELEYVGMQAWLSAYHNDYNEHIMWDELHGRSGSIQAALNLELATDSIHQLNIKAEGLNGQLPNLDLINTVVRLCRRETVAPALQKRVDVYDSDSLKGYLHHLQTMMGMMLKQARGSPTGNHGLFHRYHIEAVTLEGVKIKSRHAAIGFREIGRVVEGVCRSLNNLLERFHQSFFFYLLPSTERYISIGLYMPPFGLLAAPILIKALALWISVSFGEMPETTSPKVKVEGEKKEETKGGGDTSKSKDDVKKEEQKGDRERERPSLGALIPTCIMALFFGLTGLYGPRYFLSSARPFRMQAQDALAWGGLALQVSAMLFPRLLKRKANMKGEIYTPDTSLQKCIGLIATGLVLAATSLMNISLAFFITATWAPVLLIVYPRKNRLVNLIQYLLLLAISPMGLLYLSSLAASIMSHGGAVSGEEIGVIHAKAWSGVQLAVMTGVVDGGLLGCWTYGLVVAAIFPCWLMFWSLMWTT